jgi:hypothetical protein
MLNTASLAHRCGDDIFCTEWMRHHIDALALCGRLCSSPAHGLHQITDLGNMPHQQAVEPRTKAASCLRAHEHQSSKQEQVMEILSVLQVCSRPQPGKHQASLTHTHRHSWQAADCPPSMRRGLGSGAAAVCSRSLSC